ncbi:DUF5977 domain-containing protein [Flavobacterium sp. LC2016-01]|uniref:DUF5977 domain-containing protein n=1 Tax=Flavobacterium sp. LC2016-01 TaxID=2675876 RepID=UPI0012BA8AAA|nr:DUF5977 domain-containing protein [Flavobacterium sp. LC2016-01]MTH18282.1 hypothetical protein [Flavobacterium sp. LC2016-01]
MGNTGYKSFTFLEKYYIDDNTPTGETKPNAATDPDYIAPALDITSCPPSSRYYNTQQSKTVTKNNCETGYSGSDVTLIAYENQFVSNMSITDANNQALAWLENNAQIYANNIGVCEIVDDSNSPNPPILSSNLSAEGTIINLSWTIPYDNVGVTEYNLYRKVGLNGDWALYIPISHGDKTSFSDNALEPQTIYYYRMTARDAAENWSNFSNETSQITAESGPFCFVEGTLITLADGTQKPIESLELNQSLLSAEIETLNDTNDVTKLYKWSCNYLSENRITSPITKINVLTADKTIIINNGLLEATPSHSQLIQRDGVWKFVPLSDVIVGDILYNAEREPVPITSVFINSEKRKIYPLTLSPSHTYFANGILTHNVKPVDV